ncbi:MAG: type II toxin-antitoxin system RelE/ParE family toxin [Pseudomonadota bacterium]
MKYKLSIERSAQKGLSKMPHREQDRIIAAIQNLADNPRPPNAKKLTGRDAWRMRIGDYRVIYEIYDDTLIVLVVHLGHRKDIYRK